MNEPALSSNPESSDGRVRIKVLLVEDRRADALLVRHALSAYQNAQFEVTVAEKLVQALDHLAMHKPDVVIADLNLPDSLGLDTFMQISRASPVTPLVIMTADADTQLGVKAVDAGAQDYLVKGEIESLALGRLIMQAIARQRLRQSLADHLSEIETTRTQLHNIVDLNLDGMVIIDRGGQVIFANRQAEYLFGMPRSDLIGFKLGRPVTDEVGTEIALADRTGKLRRVRMRLQATGWADEDAFLVLLSEATVEKPERDSGVVNLDSVTGLFNRRMFYEQAGLCLTHARRHHLTPAMLCINLHNFRRINETMGHNCGDELLRLVGERIRRQLRAGDIVGRFGGDEFLVLLSSLRRATDASNVAHKILDSILAPIDLWQQNLRISARVGTSIFPRDGSNVDELVRHAQVAGQRAKETPGSSRVEFYTAELTSRSERRFNLEQRLRRALPQSQFQVYYQPILPVSGEGDTSVEALLRWFPPEGDSVGPAEFIPILEETGLIGEVGDWMLRQACKQVRQWHDAGVRTRLSANISPLQFESANLFSSIESALADSGLPARYLTVEITESALMRNANNSADTLKALRSMGVSVSIDDFGTGFSSLNYLKRFAIDHLKIDRSFIRDVTKDPNDAAITRATIDLAHNLGLRVVAEGVEDDSQLEFLREHGCDAFQGFLISRPVPSEEILLLLRQAG